MFARQLAPTIAWPARKLALHDLRDRATNRRLMNPPAEAATTETRRTIGRWGILHASRSALRLVQLRIAGNTVANTAPIMRASCPGEQHPGAA
jgi:hypothetical protein